MVDFDPKALVEQLQNLIGYINGIGSGLDSLGDKTAKTISIATAGWNESGGALKKVVENYSGLGGFLDKFKVTLEENQDAAIGLASALAAMKIDLPQGAFSALSKDIQGANMAVESFNKLNAIKNVLPKEIQDAVDKFKNLAGSVDTIRNVENQLMKLQIQSGDLGPALKSFGDNLQGLDQHVTNFGAKMKFVANATGTTTEETTRFAMGLMQAPGLLNEVTNLVGASGEKLDLMSAALKVARAVGIDHNAVQEMMVKQNYNFNSSGEKTIEIISRMHQAVSASGVPFELLRKSVDSISESFKFFGNQSQAAITIMTNLGPALRDSGLGPAAIQELVNGVAGAVKELNIAQKAFISVQTGGVGGLQGAFQIEQSMREGKLDEVVQKTFDTIQKQFGGPIVTLEEAANDQQAAAQLVKQTAMLRAGPLGSIVKSDQEAYRLLEAFKTGGAGGAVTALATPEEAVNETLKAGEEIQKRQETILTKIGNEAEHMSQLIAQQVYLQSRSLVGAGGEGRMAEFLRESREFATAEIGRINEAERERKAGTETGFVGYGDGPTKTLIDQATSAIDFATNFGKQVFETVIKDTGKDKPDFIKPATESRTGEELVKHLSPQPQANVILPKMPEEKTTETAGIDAKRMPLDHNVTITVGLDPDSVKKEVRLAINENNKIRDQKSIMGQG